MSTEAAHLESAHDAAPGGHGHLQTSTGVSNEKMAMWVFLGSECLLFGALISTYLLYHDRGDRGPLPSDIYDIPFTSVSSFVLLMSSLTMVLAVSAMSRRDQRAMRVWLLATAFLGMVFLAGQVYEFTSFVREGMGLTTNVASGAFFVLTGFHGAHVTLGIVMLLSVTGMSLGGKIADGSESVEIAGLYWHFVDVVWIIIFTVVYLLAPGQ